MEEKVFRRPAVAGKLKEFIEARLHTDHADASKNEFPQALEKQLANTIAAPVYVTLNPDTGVKLEIQEGATSDENFIAFLERSLANRERGGESELEVSGSR
jgi:hypothetical protein